MTIIAIALLAAPIALMLVLGAAFRARALRTIPVVSADFAYGVEYLEQQLAA